jgi:hypothetical protein
LPPATAARSFSPDGCAIAARPEIQLHRAWRIAPEQFLPASVQATIVEEPPTGLRPMPERLTYRYSGRSILAELEVDGARFVVGSFHATPGTSEVGGVQVDEWKPFFHGAVAIEIAALELHFVFAIDANEPLSETVEAVRFHWDDARSGVKKLQALLGLTPIHRARDLFREHLHNTGGKPASTDVLFATYAPNAGFQRRFDSMWATPGFGLLELRSRLKEVIAIGGDHALLVADLRLQ